MNARRTVSSAACGMLPLVFWQLSSRIASFAVQAVAVRAIGPSNFAFSHVRLGLLHAISTVAFSGTRRIASRARSEEVAAALLYIGILATVCCGIVAGFAFCVYDASHVGQYALAVAAAAMWASSERGIIFARRRERYGQLARARACASLVGSVSSVVVVALLPKDLAGGYAAPVGHFVHMLLAKFVSDVAAGSDVPAVRLRTIRLVLNAEDVRLVSLAVMQQMYDFFHSNAEGIVLDVACPDDMKAAYKLAESIGLSLGRFFSDALEEQTFNVFRAFAYAFDPREIYVDSCNASSSSISSCVGVEAQGETTFSAQLGGHQGLSEQQVVQEELLSVLHTAIKAALLVYLSLAAIGSTWSHFFMRSLYGTTWADETPAITYLTIYLMFLILLAIHGLFAALFEATASSSSLKRQSMCFAVVGLLQIVALYTGGTMFSAPAIIAVNWAVVLVKIAFYILYYCQFTGRPLASLVTCAPHVAVWCVLLAARVVCSSSEQRLTVALEMNSANTILRPLAVHVVTAAASLLALSLAVLRYERRFVAYCASLRSSAKNTVKKKRSHEG